MNSREHLETLVSAWKASLGHPIQSPEGNAFTDALQAAIGNVDDAFFAPYVIRDELDALAENWNALGNGCPNAFDVESELHFIMRYGIQALLDVTKG